MKKLLSFVLCLAMIGSFVLVANAAESGDVVSFTEYRTENGLTVRDEVIVYPQSRSSTVAGAARRNIYDGDTLIAVIAFEATFRYDGSTVSVVSKSVIQTDTYDGWSYSQTSFTSSGGTVSLTGKLSKWLILNTTFTMTLTCDKDGNIS